MPNYSGQDIGRYHILDALGEGGMATVYKAFDTHLECYVAVKFIRVDRLTADMAGNMLERFEREAKLVAQLNHPNIVKISDYGTFAGVPYLVMPYLPGGTLEDLNGKRIPYAEAARLLAPIARALNYAHQRKILHRDVKPLNLLISETGQLILTDFGIAKILEEERSIELTGIGMGIGTPEYMAPEQWLGKTEPVSDEYSLGVVFYEMVTGHKPYDGDTPAAILLKQRNDPLPNPKKYIRGLPDRIEQVMLKALARDPRGRYPNLGAFALALEEIALKTTSPGVTLPFLIPAAASTNTPNDISTAYDPARDIPFAQNKRNRFPWLFAAGASALLLVMCILITLLFRGVWAARADILPKAQTPTLGPGPTKAIAPVPTQLSTSTPTPAPNQPAASWKQGKLVYLAGSKTNRNVYWQDLQTEDKPRLIANSQGDERFLGVVLSPDGSHVVWYDANSATLKQASSSGEAAGTLANCIQPFFAADGSRMVCVGKGGLRIISVQDGKTLSQVSTGSLQVVLPAWSPEKDEIVFSTFESNGGTSIWRVNLTGGEPTALANSAFENYAPAWSPDAEWIAYQSADKESNSEIWIMDRDGGQARQITHTNGWSRGPCYSPDGKWLIFVSNQAGSIGPDSGEVFAQSLETGELLQLTHTGGEVYDWRAFWAR